MNRPIQILVSFLIAILLYWGLVGAIGGLTELLSSYKINSIFETIFLIIYPFTFGGFLLLGIWLLSYIWILPKLGAYLNRSMLLKRASAITICPNKKLTYLALVVWIISLMLPAAQWRGSIHLGFEVLVLGLGLGWLNIYGGWAAYSNLFFIVACYTVIAKSHKKINVTQIALMLSLGVSGTLFFTKIVGHPPNEVVLKEGAVVWLASYVLLTFACLWAGCRAKRVKNQLLNKNEK